MLARLDTLHLETCDRMDFAYSLPASSAEGKSDR